MYIYIYIYILQIYIYIYRERERERVVFSYLFIMQVSFKVHQFGIIPDYTRIHMRDAPIDQRSILQYGE